MDGWEEIIDKMIDEMPFYDFKCPILYHTGDDLPSPCQLTQCKHHVVWDGTGWKFHETEVTRKFYNCMCMLEGCSITLQEIAAAIGTSWQNVAQMEARALERLHEPAKEYWPDEYDEKKGGKASRVQPEGEGLEIAGNQHG